MILTGPEANPDKLYIAKLVGCKGFPDPGMPARFGQRSSEPGPESGRRAPEPTIPESIDPRWLRSIRPRRPGFYLTGSPHD